MQTSQIQIDLTLLRLNLLSYWRGNQILLSEVFYKHFTDGGMKSNILDDAHVTTNAFCNPHKVDEDFIDYISIKCRKLHNNN